MTHSSLKKIKETSHWFLELRHTHAILVRRALSARTAISLRTHCRPSVHICSGWPVCHQRPSTRHRPLLRSGDQDLARSAAHGRGAHRRRLHSTPQSDCRRWRYRLRRRRLSVRRMLRFAGGTLARLGRSARATRWCQTVFDWRCDLHLWWNQWVRGAESVRR